MTFQELWEILESPREVNQDTFAGMWWWMRPKRTEEGKNICQVIVDSGAMDSLSDARRKIKEGGVKWNGERVTDWRLVPSFIEPGWGVVKIGKKNHSLVIT